ncbi:MAG: RluA family pseudouridine synthase, partial [Blastocatellia bacterium]|nr:RluA family pseudouridine synthase [Blastocatellia bacterium]
SEPKIRPGLVHRLDKQTSGLIVAAKTDRAHRFLSRQFGKKRVEKRYSAIVEGLIDDDEGVIDAPIARFPELKLWAVNPDGKHAETRFWVNKRMHNATLLDLEPVTGRTNQLRIHLAHIGHPIKGDIARGSAPASRLYLHARRLAFDHPVTNERVNFERDPQDFTDESQKS